MTKKSICKIFNSGIIHDRLSALEQQHSGEPALDWSDVNWLMTHQLLIQALLDQSLYPSQLVSLLSFSISFFGFETKPLPKVTIKHQLKIAAAWVDFECWYCCQLTMLLSLMTYQALFTLHLVNILIYMS